MNGGLITYESGLNISETYKYGNNFTGYHWDYVGSDPMFNPADLNDPATVFLFHKTVEETVIYSSFNDNAGTYVLGISLNHFFGWLITLIGALGFAISLGSMRNQRGMKDG